VLVGYRLAEEPRLLEEAAPHYRTALEIEVEFNERNSRRMFQ
jgi:hypothetical protein